MSSLSTPASRPDGRGAGEPLLVLVDPAAGRADGESVRIARDVLCGGADAKVVLPESRSELDRVLSHRGRRRPVVIGSDQAVHKVLQALHRQRDLGTDPVGVVPVGPAAPSSPAARSGCRSSRWPPPGRCSGAPRASSTWWWTTAAGWCSPSCGSARSPAGPCRHYVRYGRNGLRPTRRPFPTRSPPRCGSKRTDGCSPTSTSGSGCWRPG
ncbi:nucleoside-diphosphate sugar epimerase/dehydratase [Kitasatospora arboriphila]